MFPVLHYTKASLPEHLVPIITPNFFGSHPNHTYVTDTLRCVGEFDTTFLTYDTTSFVTCFLFENSQIPSRHSIQTVLAHAKKLEI